MLHHQAAIRTHAWPPDDAIHKGSCTAEDYKDVIVKYLTISQVNQYNSQPGTELCVLTKLFVDTDGLSATVYVANM